MNEIPNPPSSPSETERQVLVEKERKFHEERWQKKADVKKSWLGMVKKSPYAVMWEEARRDDADFDKRDREEFEAWQKNLKVVTENFKERAQNPEKTDRKTLIVILGGGMKCAYAAGQVMGLNALGISADKVDAVVGASGGAVVATAYVGGKEQTERTADMMAGPMSSTDFIDPSLKRFKEGRVIDLKLLGEKMSETGGEYAIDEDEIRRASTELWYTMTLPHVGDENPSVKFLNAKDPNEVPSMVEGIKASMSLHPRLTGPAGVINGVEYRDGAISPLPIEEIIKHFNPTDVLILPQLPYEYVSDVKPSAGEHIGATLAKVAGFDAVAKGLVSRIELRKSLELIQQQEHVNIGVMWPPDGGLTTLSIDGDEFKAGVIASYRDTLKQFGAGEPLELPFLGVEAKRE